MVAAVIGAAGSLFLMLRVGHRAPIFLLVLFVGWVLAPFVALVVADRVRERWAAGTRTALYWLMLLVTIGSLVVYGMVALGPPRPKPAAAFLLVPLASWVIMGVVLFLAGRRSRRA